MLRAPAKHIRQRDLNRTARPYHAFNAGSFDEDAAQCADQLYVEAGNAAEPSGALIQCNWRGARAGIRNN